VKGWEELEWERITNFE